MTELQIEEGTIKQQKAQRVARKKRMLGQWEQASHSQRMAWIEAAAERQTATTLRQIISRQKPTTEAPKYQVLDEIAFDLSLPPVSQSSPTGDANSPRVTGAIAEQPQASQTAPTFVSQPSRIQPPQKESPTEMASF